ncbi:MAG: flagellar biosynthesis anti-sigma factor FlgM [Peptostreptococcales bacterium]
MKIDNSGYSKYVIKAYEKMDGTKKTESDNEGKKNNNNIAADSFEISSASKEISRYIEQIRNQNVDVDMEKVNQIKNDIAKGQYAISPEEIAKKMIEKMKEEL